MEEVKKIMNINPVLMKEIKVKMRDWKAAGLIAGYVAVLSLVTVFIMMVSVRELYVGPNVAIVTYIVLSVIQFFLLIFIVPALTSGAISGERERQTLDLILCTKMKPLSIITGKLFASMSQAILLVVSSMPVFSVVFMYGGISIVEVLELYLFYIVVAIMMGSIGIFFSTFTKKTTVSNVCTYGAILVLLFGTAFFAIFYATIFIRSKGAAANYNQTMPIMYMNPLAGFASLLVDQFGGYNATNFRIPGFYVPNMNYGSSTGLKNISLWQINIAIDLIISAILIFLTAIKVNPVKKIKKKKKTKAA